MTFVSYAQNFEDVLLWRALHDVENGRYLDIGAQDPIVDSVSLAFYEAGWRGVHVEPVPAFAARLREARADEDVIEAAVTDEEGPIPFFELGGLSSGRAEVAQHHASQGHASREISVATVRLEAIFDRLGAIVHWMKIDVEGMEADVLRSWRDHATRPWILVIESTFPNTQEPTQHFWEREVLLRGYKEVHFDGLSRYFLHEAQSRLEPRFSAPANVFDHFHVTRAHFTAGLVASQGDQLKAELEERQIEFDSTLQGLRERLETSGNEIAGERERRSAIEIHARELATALHTSQQAEAAAKLRADKAQTDRFAALQAVAAAEQEKSSIIDRLWRERQQAESDLERDKAARIDRLWRERQEGEEKLRQQQQAIEADLRNAMSSREAELRTAENHLRDWRSKAEQQTGRVQTLEAETSELRRQIDDLGQLLSALEGTIGDALQQSESVWQRLGRALRITGEDPARDVLRSRRPSFSIDAQLSRARHVRPPNFNKRGLEERVGMGLDQSLDEVIALPSDDFVTAAYRLILGRDPDPEGLAYYKHRLSSGRSRLRLLRQILESPEARKRGDATAALNHAVRQKELAALPLIGALFRNGATGQRGLERNEVQRQTQPSGLSGQTAAPSLPGGQFATVEQFRALADDMAKLRSVLDGFGYALEGVAKAQTRHEKLLAGLPSKNRTSVSNQRIGSRPGHRLRRDNGNR